MEPVKKSDYIGDSFRQDCHKIVDKEELFLLLISTAIVEGEVMCRVSICGSLPSGYVPDLPEIVRKAVSDTMSKN